MKFQIDTTRKTIKIEEDAQLDRVFAVIKKLLPDNEWKKYTLKTNTEFVWRTYPCTHTCPCDYTITTTTTTPWYTTGTIDSTKADISLLKAGVYNVEV